MADEGKAQRRHDRRVLSILRGGREVIEAEQFECEESRSMALLSESQWDELGQNLLRTAL